MKPEDARREFLKLGYPAEELKRMADEELLAELEVLKAIHEAGVTDEDVEELRDRLKETSWGDDWTGFLFADPSRLFEHGWHVLFVGLTGQGKTTNMTSYAVALLNRGWRIFWRDDSGLEWLALAWHYPDETLVFVPKGCRLEGLDFLEFAEYDPEKPMNIFRKAERSGRSLFPILFDVFCWDLEYTCRFYSRLFTMMIYHLARMPYSKKSLWAFFVDELNDLVQPHGREITKAHAEVRGTIVFNLRKVRKHGFKLVASTHRLTQIPLDVRTNFSYHLIHKSLGYDVYEFFSKALITAPAKVFWTVLKCVITQEPGECFFFDYKWSYDWIKPRMIIDKDTILKRLEWRIEGTVGPEPEADRWTWERQGAELILRALRNALKTGHVRYRDIAKAMGLTGSWVFEVINDRILGKPELKALWDEVLELARLRVVRRQHKPPPIEELQ